MTGALVQALELLPAGAVVAVAVAWAASTPTRNPFRDEEDE